ncbi:MAG TPA: type I secretion system permease/ATPase [Burkholderiales bacterium]|nr:type I secretion system permease/ATPase [Burkholderiales bacterium]
MRELISRFRPFFVYAALFSMFINILVLAPAAYMMQIFDRVMTGRSEETLVMLTLVAVPALMVMAVMESLRARLLIACGAAMDRKLGPRVLEGVLAQTARLSGAEYVNGMRDVSTLRSFLSGNGIFAMFDAPWLPFFLVLIFLFHPLLGSVATCGAVVMVTLAILNERTTRKPLEKVQAESRVASRMIDASVRNADVVSALGMVRAVNQRWAEKNEAVLRLQTRATAAGRTLSGLSKFTRQVIQIAMVGTGAWLVVDLNVTPGVMLATTLVLGRALGPVEALVANWKNMVEARAAWLRLDKLLAGSPPVETGTELPAPRGEVSVERVVFGIRGADKPIIRGVSLRLPAGETLGIIGPSAAGKSTLARLLIGVWKPNSGVVRLDGADVAVWPRELLGPHIGYLPQDVELFSGTVAENIARLGEIDSEAVIRAAQRAHVHDLILRLPKGYDTEVGEGGATLSPGQRQRIGLARAVIGDPRLVLLDEPNANLDHDGEQALVQTMRELKSAGVTVIVIAHRPSLLGSADKILVLRDGAVDMFGPRAEILQKVTRVAPPPLPPAARGVA